MRQQSGSPGLLMMRAMAFFAQGEAPPWVRARLNWESVGDQWDPAKTGSKPYSRRRLPLTQAVLFTSTATTSPLLHGFKSGTNVHGRNQKHLKIQGAPATRPRSGRGGRRFKSCHSDHHLRRSRWAWSAYVYLLHIECGGALRPGVWAGKFELMSLRKTIEVVVRLAEQGTIHS